MDAPIPSGACEPPPWSPGLRFLTAEVPPIALRFKQREEDFYVEELPAFEPCGFGEHLWLEVEKVGLSTMEMLRILQRAFGLAHKDVGFAGRKDARAVTRQWVSLCGVQESAVQVLVAQGLDSPQLRVLRVARHERKLRLGQLAGNRFRILLRDVAHDQRANVNACLERIQQRGLPNYFGAQRFGLHGFAYELGQLLIEGRSREYLLALTSPRHAPERPAVAQLHAAIALNKRAEMRGLAALVPDLPFELGALARQLARRPGDWSSALRALDRANLSFHLSAWQSRLFNRLLAARLDEFDVPQVGDLCTLHPTNSFFEVTREDDLDVLRTRAADFEISPTGPLPGTRAPLANGAPGEQERWALGAEGLRADAGGDAGPGDESAALELKGPRGLELPGARRSLRARVEGLELEWTDAGLRLEFSLPPGAYATVLISELSKRPQ